MQKLIMSSKCSHGSSRLSSVTNRQCVKGSDQSSHVCLFVCLFVFNSVCGFPFFQMSFCVHIKALCDGFVCFCVFILWTWCFLSGDIMLLFFHPEFLI